MTVHAKGMNKLMVCFGEFFLEFVPTVREISIDDALIFEKAPGGAPANVAFGIAKLWRNAAFVDKVLLNYPTDYDTMELQT